MEVASTKRKAFIAASIAGLMMAGAAIVAPTAFADVGCYGVNKCKGTGSCKGTIAGCGGKNGCKGQGKIHVKDAATCLAMQGGSLTPVKAK